MNIVTYSVIMGGYDQPKPAPPGGGVLITDDPQFVAPGWDVRIVEVPHLPTPMLASRWAKIQPEQFLLDINDGDITVYIDGSVTVTASDYERQCLDALAGDDAAWTRHPDRDCIYDELDVCCTLAKYPADAMCAQVEHYRTLGHPPRWGLIACTVMVRRNTKAMRWLGAKWWAHNLAWSWMDQLSLPVLLRGMGDGLRWNAGLSWCQFWTISGREWGHG